MMSLINVFSIILALTIIIPIHAESQPPIALNYNEKLGIQREGCPMIDDPLHPVFFPYPGDCSRYLSCFNGLAYPHSCPTGLYWSSTTYRCDYPANANCPPEFIPTSPPSYIIPSYPSQSPEYSYLSYNGDCNKYYQCQLVKCPPSYHWNAMLQRCDWPQTAGCVAGGISTTSVTSIPTSNIDPSPSAATPPPNPTTYPIVNPQQPQMPIYPIAEDITNLNQLCSTTGSTYIHYPGDCTRYVQCNGVAYVRRCPANLLWNSDLLACDRFCV